MKFGISLHLQLPRDPARAEPDPAAEARALAQAVELVVEADGLGFDYVFLVEHHFLDQYSLASAPDVFLGYVAARTRRIRLGLGVVQMEPRLAHPAKLAGRVATLDALSGGRVELGMGSMGSRAERELFGLAPEAEAGEWMAPARECLRMLGLSPYPGGEGPRFRFGPGELVPKPVQRPHPPVWRAIRTAEAVAEAARFGVGALGIQSRVPKTMGALVAEYWEALRPQEPLGLALNPATAVFANMLCLADGDEARRQGARDAAYFGFASTEAGKHPHLARAFEAAWAAGPETMANRYSVHDNLFGTPEELRARLRAMEVTRIDLVLLQVQTGTRPPGLVLESLRRFAADVSPEFVARHAEHQRWRAERLEGLGLPVVSSI